MDEPTKRMADVILGVGQLLVILSGAIWGYFRFRRERTHVPRVSFTIMCRFYGPQAGNYIAEFLLTIKNAGVVIHRFHDIGLRVLGISKDDSLTLWPGNEPRLLFPDKLVDDKNVIYK